MTTPEPTPPTRPQSGTGAAWRDLVQSGADGAQIEGFALEQLIDMQRARRPRTGEDR